jgi:hypothetical protein
MKMFLIALALVAGVAAPTVASANYNCTTTCTGFGNMRTCNTWCY